MSKKKSTERVVRETLAKQEAKKKVKADQERARKVLGETFGRSWVWLLTQTNDGLVADNPDVEDLLVPGRVFTSEEAAKTHVQRLHEERLRKQQKGVANNPLVWETCKGGGEYATDDNGQRWLVSCVEVKS